MRDIAILAIVGIGLIYTLTRPQIGIYLWAWIGYMAPHRLTWGFAYTLPFAQAIGLVTIMAIAFSKESKNIPWNAVTITLVLFILWMGLTTLFALEPGPAWALFSKVIKIQVVIFLTLMIIKNKERMVQLIWVIVVSIGFYGIKGGIFSLRTMGEYRVTGPPETFITGNTEIGLALLMILPLMYFLFLETKNKYIRWGLLLSMGFTLVAIIATYSRGALLGLLAIGFFLFIKSKQKLYVGVLVAICVPVALYMMPEQWTSRMHTIETYQQDSSAMGRILAWKFAFDMASQRFLGGGFESFTPANYQRFAPEIIPADGRYQAAHSNYFQVLGHHGFVGLGLFLTLLLLMWKTGSRIIRATKGKPELLWAYNMAAMIQVSMIGYMVAGAFLALAYFDLIYHLMALLVLLEFYIKNNATQDSSDQKDNQRKEKRKLDEATVQLGHYTSVRKSSDD